MVKEDVFEDTSSKVLVIKWNNINDTLQLGVREIFKEVNGLCPTKRNILKIIASIYDPVGYLAPVCVSLKLLFQDLPVKYWVG